MDVAPNLLPRGRQIHLCSVSSGKNLRMMPGSFQLDGKGGPNAPTKFIIDPSPTGFLRLRSVANPDRYLAIRGGELTTGKLWMTEQKPRPRRREGGK
jgi:hypothetical protein